MYSEYILCYVALCGVCEKATIIDSTANTSHTRKVVNQLIKEKLLTEINPQGKRKVLKLTRRGYDIISQIPFLGFHYDTITEKNGIRTDYRNIERACSTAAIINTCIRNHILVSRIEIEYIGRRGGKKIQAEPRKTEIRAGEKIPTVLPNTYLIYEADDLKEMKAPEDFVNRNRANFLPGQILKRDGKSASNFNQSRARGAIIGRGFVYGTYLINRQTKIVDAYERALSVFLSGFHARVFKDNPVKNMSRDNSKGSALIFLPKDEDVMNMLDGKYIDNEYFLTRIYSHTYMVPQTMDKLRQYLTDGFREKTIQKAFTKEQIEEVHIRNAYGSCHAIVEGTYAVELCSLDLCTLILASQIMEDRDVKIYCENYSILIDDWLENTRRRKRLKNDYEIISVY